MNSRSKVSLDDLLRRATGGLTLVRERIFRPSMVYRLLRDPFGLWCDYHAPEEEAVEEVSRYDEQLMQQGKDYEEQWVKKNHPEAVRIYPEYGYEALVHTLKVMLEGVEAIHHPQLWLLAEGIYGKGDIIVRSDRNPSDLGPYHYRVKEIKHSRNLQDYHRLQAALYNLILGNIQGYLPKEVEVVLPSGEEVVSYQGLLPEINKILSRWKKIRDGELKPEPSGLDKTSSPWRCYANRILRERRDLTLLPDIGVAGRERLSKKLGVSSIDELYSLSLDDLKKAWGPKAAISLYYHIQAYRTNQAIKAPGKELKIPRGRRHLYFDFETSDEVHPLEPPHVYLIGLWDGERDKYVYFLGRGSGDESKIFNDFIEYLGSIEGICLYHWTDFEVGMIKEVASRYPALSGPLNRILNFCIDMHKLVREYLYLPVPSYSIKEVAPWMGFHWRQKEVGAFDFMVLYWDYLEDGDRDGIQKVLYYNEDDCRAMLYIDQWLVDHKIP